MTLLLSNVHEHIGREVAVTDWVALDQMQVNIFGEVTRWAKRAIDNFGRSFIALYMFTLINFTKRVMKPQEPKNFGDQFLVWERILQASSRSFLDGEAPGIRDMMLFGVIQCHSSIPVPPLTALQRDERLNRVRKWIAHMHALFNDYPYLYSGKYFEPYSTEPGAADATQRILFYAGLPAMILAAPLTIPLVFY